MKPRAWRKSVHAHRFSRSIGSGIRHEIDLNNRKIPSRTADEIRSMKNMLVGLTVVCVWRGGDMLQLASVPLD